MAPDSRPIIGGSSLVNLFLNCGHGMLGWTLACGSADLVAALIANEPLGEREMMARDFSLRRFGGGLASRRPRVKRAA
jgi:D-amino-acid dehydrogenase